MLNITSRCNMQCKNCALEVMTTKEKRKLPSDMDFVAFKKIVNNLIDYGFDEFQLTPTVGEPFLHPNFLDMIEYLETNDKVKRITFFTNFAVNDIGKDILWLMQNTRKTVMFVSVYGTNRSDFDQYTNTKNCFSNFSTNMALLKSYYKSSFRSLNFFIRNPKYNTSKKTLINMYINTLVKIKPTGEFFDRNNIQEHFWNGNWCSNYENVENKRIDVKENICYFSFIDNIVDSDFNIRLCGACDVLRETIIGNMLYESLDEIYSKDGEFYNIIKNQLNNCYDNTCCGKCSEFHKIDENIKNEWFKFHGWNDIS